MSSTQTQTISYPLTQFGSHPDNISALIPSDNTSLGQHGDGLARKSARLQQIFIILQLFVVTFTASIINGLVIVGLPTITDDLQLPSSLAFWPASVSGLATASTLLLAGSIADSIGPRWVELAGCFISGFLMIGQGLSRTGQELVAMRAIQGIGLALHLASAVSIITQTFAPGKGRNMAFSMLGLSQPAGFSVGLVLGGVLVDLAGWRVGWYMSGGLTLLFGVIGLWALPKSQDTRSAAQMFSDLRHKSDWIGAMLASTFMAMLCYSLAVISADVNHIKQADCIVLLCLTAMALPAFLAWMHRQVRLGKPALIPNSLWKNATFSSICAAIALSFAVINSMELFASLFFQEIQELNALQASIRILPSLVVGILTNLVVGAVVHRVPAVWIVTLTSILCAGSPLLMAVIKPYWPYWGSAFVAQILQPVSGDALFTVGLLIITENFSEDTQALAGAVFNTAAQFGSALGIAILQVISTTVTQEQNTEKEQEALMAGYRASFWTMFGFMLLCTVIGSLGLRKAGRIGLKRD